MANFILFYIIIFAANIIQGITGFAGTILAMPFGLLLVGYTTAKPVLNVLGLLSGVYVFAGGYRYVDCKELKKIIAVMTIGIISGFLIKEIFVGKERTLYKLLGIFVIGISLYKMMSQTVADRKIGIYKTGSVKGKSISAVLYFILLAAGVVHGIFVAGGPLLIGYLTEKIKEKKSFRATISTVWIFMNSIILFDDVRTGLWSMGLVQILMISVPVLIVGMYIGGRMYVTMSQKLFMYITYILLLVSGALLLFK